MCSTNVAKEDISSAGTGKIFTSTGLSDFWNRVWFHDFSWTCQFKSYKT